MTPNPDLANAPRLVMDAAEKERIMARAKMAGANNDAPRAFAEAAAAAVAKRLGLSPLSA